MSKLLALDQSSRITGWCVFEDKNLITYGKFKLTDENIGDRLYQLRIKIQELIVEYEIDEIAFEDIQYQNNVSNNVQTFKVLAEVFGIIYELATELNIPNTAVLAGTWKSTLGIKGKNRAEQKQNAQLYVNTTYNIKATQDECDAICIGTHIINKKPMPNGMQIKDDGFFWTE